jgi:hypothetical protein
VKRESRARRFAVPVDDVQHPRWDSSLVHKLSEFSHLLRGQYLRILACVEQWRVAYSEGCFLTSLHHQGTPSSQSRSNLMDTKNDWDVPWNDGGDNANRLAKSNVHKPPRIQIAISLVVVTSLGVVMQLLSSVESIKESRDGTAHGSRVEDGEFFMCLCAEVSELLEVNSSLVGFEFCPCRESCFGGGNSFVCIFLRGFVYFEMLVIRWQVSFVTM